jgi:hypothetical protein
MPVQLRYSQAMPLSELARVPLVAERALPVATAAPTLIGVESVAQDVALAYLVDKIGVGLGISVVSWLLPPDTFSFGESL